jgi:hypothetical protein
MELGYCSPHNQYLGLLVENGVIAFLLYILFLIYTGRYSTKSGNKGSRNLQILRRCVLSSFVVVLASQMFTYFGLRNYLFWSIIALIYCLHDIAVRESAEAKTSVDAASLDEPFAKFSGQETEETNAASGLQIVKESLL